MPWRRGACFPALQASLRVVYAPGVDGKSTTVSLFDPLDGGTAKAHITGREDDRLMGQVSLTDHPRLLEVTDD